MNKNNLITLELHRQSLGLDENQRSVWLRNIIKETIPTNKIAICICDMWDKHWSSGASARVSELAIKMNNVVKIARSKGIQIIHAPSDTLAFYTQNPARQRLIIKDEKQKKSANKFFKHLKPARVQLPINDSDGGSDTPQSDLYRRDKKVWTRQIATIEIDDLQDGISDKGPEIYSFLKERGINTYLIMGVHTNMCILHRSFGIRMMNQLGLKVALVRDLTDAMYNPAKPPYVSHAEGTALVCDYIEKFYCATIQSKDLTE
jgi:nicotinamidase-related amidase